jgi:hypothetical protein
MIVVPIEVALWELAFWRGVKFFVRSMAGDLASNLVRAVSRAGRRLRFIPPLPTMANFGSPPRGDSLGSKRMRFEVAGILFVAAALAQK